MESDDNAPPEKAADDRPGQAVTAEQKIAEFFPEPVAPEHEDGRRSRRK